LNHRVVIAPSTLQPSIQPTVFLKSTAAHHASPRVSHAPPRRDEDFPLIPGIDDIDDRGTRHRRTRRSIIERIFRRIFVESIDDDDAKSTGASLDPCDRS
jgi:hypothetical protein